VNCQVSVQSTGQRFGFFKPSGGGGVLWSGNGTRISSGLAYEVVVAEGKCGEVTCDSDRQVKRAVGPFRNYWPRALCVERSGPAKTLIDALFFRFLHEMRKQPRDLLSSLPVEVCQSSRSKLSKYNMLATDISACLLASV
jgi:hypothetical protein